MKGPRPPGLCPRCTSSTRVRQLCLARLPVYLHFSLSTRHGQHGRLATANTQLTPTCTASAGDLPSQVLPGIAETTAQSPTGIARWPKALPHPHPKPIERAPALPSHLWVQRHYCSGVLHARARGASVSSNHSKQRAAHDRKGGELGWVSVKKRVWCGQKGAAAEGGG